MADIEDKPRNGLAGLKHWRYDLAAGLQVALVSLPLSLGIAVASGAPPVTGIISAIIAGLVFPFLGGAYVTISGPAAGLAPALLAGMLLLGSGDIVAGYPLLLVAICLTGLVQVILSLFRAGKLVAMFLPVTVVEAMLAAIGMMIIIKQVPALLGDLSAPAKTISASILKLPQNFLNIEPAILVIGAVCLFLIFFLNRTRHVWLRRIPPPLTICAIGVVMALAFDLDARYLIAMPDNILEGGFTLPAFDIAWERRELWGSILTIVVTLTLIDGIESLATIKAVDKIDPFQRKSHPNVTLRAMGVSNMLSSIAGGLTIIPGGIKSRANIDAGGRTLWANFFNALFLILFLFFAKEIISLIPLAAIGAVLVYVGWRLCEPTVFSRTFAIGRDQFVVFLVTIAAVLATDLLIGILVGVVTEVLLLTYLLSPSLRLVLTGRIGLKQLLHQVSASLTGLIRSPVIAVTPEGGATPRYRFSLSSLTGFNLFALDRALGKVPDKANITLAMTESGRLVDHTAMEYVHEMQEESLQHGRSFTITGLEAFKPFTNHPMAARVQDARLSKEKIRHTARAQDMIKLAQQHGFDFTEGPVATLNRHDLIYLRRGENREERNIISGTLHDCEIRLFDYSHTAAPDYHLEHRHTLLIARAVNPAGVPLPNLVFTPGHYLERYLVQYQEIEIIDEISIGEHYHVFAERPEQVLHLLRQGFADHLREHPGFYIEIRDNTLLAFRPEIETETPEDAIVWVSELTRWLGSIQRTSRGG